MPAPLHTWSLATLVDLAKAVKMVLSSRMWSTPTVKLVMVSMLPSLSQRGTEDKAINASVVGVADAVAKNGGH